MRQQSKGAPFEIKYIGSYRVVSLAGPHPQILAAEGLETWLYQGHTADLQNVLNFVRFIRESVAGGKVKQSPRTLQQELAGGKSFKLLQSPWRLLHSIPPPCSHGKP